jgi:predicted phage-related endonuclease
MKSVEWHLERRKGIGASDANILVAGDDEAILSLWREKRGEGEAEDLSWVLPVQIGIATEELNLNFYEHVTGLGVLGRGKMLTHPEHQFMRATLDGMAYCPKRGAVVVEGKHVNAFTNIPECVQKYLPQCTHAMLITGAKHCDLSIIKGTQEHVIRPLELDPFYSEALVDLERQFWECVQTGKPPRELPKVVTPVPLEDMAERDMTGQNSWAVEAAGWLQTRASHTAYVGHEKALKSLVGAADRRCYGAGIEITRNRAGSLAIKEIK